eukprot:9886440-Alexandrium_andersonii.AAC.1
MGTNYCNLKMLYCGTADGCRPVRSQFASGPLVIAHVRMDRKASRVIRCLWSSPLLRLGRLPLQWCARGLDKHCLKMWWYWPRSANACG